MTKLREYRIKRGWTQEKLAQLVGVDRTFISNLEYGKATPSLHVAYKLAKVFNTTIDDLFSDILEPFEAIKH